MDYTIIDLEKLHGMKYDRRKENVTSLPKWYAGIRSKRISQLTVGDMARALRQNIFVEHIIFECIDRLHADPICGNLYAGELMKTVADLDHGFWDNNRAAANQARALLRYVKDFIEKYDWEDEYDWDHQYEKAEFIAYAEQLTKRIS